MADGISSTMATMDEVMDEVMGEVMGAASRAEPTIRSLDTRSVMKGWRI